MSTETPRLSIEVFIEGKFVSSFPWGKFQSKSDIESVRVERVCHVTHREQARNIVDYNPDTGKLIYTFQSHEKMGKFYSMTGDPRKVIGALVQQEGIWCSKSGH